MCRFLLYMGKPIRLSSLTTEPENSLIRQSFDSKERVEPLNGDGFGIAWYDLDSQSEAALFRSITPAWSNQNLRHLAKIIHSGCVLAHVRAASIGLAVNESNTHPFVKGEYAFMHNGEVAGFKGVRRLLTDELDETYYEMIEGTTDSECLFVHVLQALGQGSNKNAEDMAAAMEQAIFSFCLVLRKASVGRASSFNIAISNGHEAVACRYSTALDHDAPSLHFHTGKLYTCRSGEPHLLEADEDDHAVIIASEPLTGDNSWRLVPNNHLLTISQNRQLGIRPISKELLSSELLGSE